MRPALNRAAFENTAAWRKGVAGELTVEQWLRGRGFFVVRLCQIRNADGLGAPMMMGAQCNVILPDFHVIDGVRAPYYVEVKHKHLAPLCYKLGYVPVHGIGVRNWEHYRRVGVMAKASVWLLILEELSGELLALRINTADPDDRDDTDTMEPGGMVFWKKSRFALVAQLEKRQERMDV